MRKNTETNTYRTAILGCIALMIALPLLSVEISASIRSAISLCYTTIIPSVFPFMVISSLLIKINGHLILERALGMPLRFLFGMSESSVCPIALGFICGYPIGASAAVGLYDHGDISKKELERLLVFINNPTPAFVIGGVGLGLFGSTTAGRSIYASMILSAVICGITTRFIYHPEHQKAVTKFVKDIPTLSTAITSSVSESAIGMLNVCACILFFSIPSTIICELLSKLGVPPLIRAISSGILEISNGVKSAAKLTDPTAALLISAFCCSWSGLSVHMQIFSVCRGREISFKGYIISKLVQSILSPAILLLFLKTNVAHVIIEDISSPTLSARPGLQYPILIIFGISLLFSLIHRSRRAVI